MILDSSSLRPCIVQSQRYVGSPRPVSSVCPVSNFAQIETQLHFLGRPEVAEAWRVNPIDQTKLIPIMRKETEEHSSSLKLLGHRVQC